MEIDEIMPLTQSQIYEIADIDRRIRYWQDKMRHAKYRIKQLEQKKKAIQAEVISEEMVEESK